jgi:hypothetical protein
MPKTKTAGVLDTIDGTLEDYLHGVANEPLANPITIADFEEVRPGVHRLADAAFFAVEAGYLEKCETCGGTGKIWICPCCHGRSAADGSSPSTRENQTCDICHGTGRVEALQNWASDPYSERAAYWFGFALDLASLVDVLNAHGLSPDLVGAPVYIGLGFVEDPSPDPV